MRRALRTIALLTLLLCAIEGLLLMLHTQTYVFPRPSEVLRAMYANAGTLSANLLVTCIESSAGFLIANTISILLAFVAYFQPKVENHILSVGVILKTIPIIALTPLLIMWFGSGIASKIATAALICFFPAMVNMIRGMKSLGADYQDLFKLYSTPTSKLIKLLLIPGSFPFLISSLKISSSLAVVGALVGEFIGANKGLGFVILVNYYNFNMPIVFAGIVLSSLLGLTYYYSLNLLERRYNRVTGKDLSA